MSYAIVRNEKLTRSQAIGMCVHNDRKAKNHSNKEFFDTIGMEETKRYFEESYKFICNY